MILIQIGKGARFCYLDTRRREKEQGRGLEPINNNRPDVG